MDKQPILQKIFQQALKKNHFANGYLLVGNSANDYPLKIVSTITNNQRVLSGNYRDYLEFKDDLKKEHVLQLQKYFSKNAQEAFGRKLYTIYNVEKASTHALNALLKFLEEPDAQTTAILTTTNKEAVLPTILSRVQVIYLLEEEKVDVEAFSLFELLEKETEIDELILKLHRNAKNYSYETFYQVYSLLISHSKLLNKLDWFEAFVEVQNEIEKGANIPLVLDRTLFKIKYGYK